MLTPSIGCCCTPLTESGWGSPASLKDGRRDVDHVMELRARFAFAFDPLGPVHDCPVACATPMRGHLLGPLIRRIHGVRPADRKVVVRFRPAQLVQARHQELRGLKRGRAIEIDHLVVGAVQRALGGCAIVADDVVDQRVVQQIQFFRESNNRPTW